MTNLTMIRNWLLSYPKWSNDLQVYTDYNEAVPSFSSLYPLGAEELSRREDVMGNVTVHCRYRFHLYRTMGLENRLNNAAWLLEFQHWVRQQSVTGKAPQFGDDPKMERIRAENGKFHKLLPPGLGTYVLTLTVEFIKHYSN